MALLSDLPRQVPAHLAFGAAAMPLILAAMSHFVPVLTRSGGAPRAVAGLPLLALLAGVGAVLSFAVPGWWVRGATMAALAAALAALAMLAWTGTRARATLGTPHPGLWWYVAALFCLLVALLAVPAMEPVPAFRPRLRLWHLHLNTLGFIGLTALGTVQVLLPTVLGRPDPLAAMRLRRGLPFGMAAVLFIAAGAALGDGWGRGLAVLGLCSWLWLLAGPLLGWWRYYGKLAWAVHGASGSLAWAVSGLALVSMLHGSGLTSGAEAIPAFFLAFLLPLVTGAVSHLLPLWLRPGRQDAWHEQARRSLGRWAGLRGPAFVLAGVSYGLGWHFTALAALPALAQFLMVLAALTVKTLGKTPHA